MDVLTPEQRKKSMRGNRSKDTSIELILRKALWHKGYRYRKNYKKLPGSPDIALTKQKVAIFCDSEFWHGKDWEVKKPKMQMGANPDYWVGKIERNMQRDHENDLKLQFLGWTVIHFWGEEITKDPDGCIKVIEEVLFDSKIVNSEHGMLCSDEYVVEES